MSTKRWVAMLLCTFTLFTSAVASEPVWLPLAERVVTHLEAAGNEYLAGKPDEARREVVKGYFGVFESEKMEAAMRTRLGAKHTYQVEKQFGDLRKAMKARAAPGEIQQRVKQLSADLRRDAGKLDEAGVPAGVFEVNK